MKLSKSRLMEVAGIDTASQSSSKADQLAKALTDAIAQIDSSMSYTDFATAVAAVLKEDYGSHNYDAFVTTLRKQLAIQ